MVKISVITLQNRKIEIQAFRL